MEYEIERMQPEDVREVAALEAKIFSIPWSEAGFLSSLQSKDTLYLAVRKSGQLIGYCGLLQSFDEADITNVAVEETYRGCGIASRMLERLMELGKARGILRYTLEVRVSNATAIHLYEKLGFRVIPNGTEPRHDIIQAVELGSAEAMEAFCQGIQAAAPVDSYVTPIPYAMPGYNCDVIMAAGAFIQGSSIELSADGPIRAPYSVYFQGGLTWFHAKTGILMSLQKLYEKGLVKI